MSNSSISITGDPFVDTGHLVLQAIQERFPDKDLYQSCEFATDIYISRWKQKLHSIFHTNSKILNPSTKGKHRDNTLEYLKMLVADSGGDETLTGYCRTCGKQGNLYPNSREFLPISGSGAFINFHHGHEAGSYLCSQCSIKIYFVPLGVLSLGGDIGLLKLQSACISNFWKKLVIEENLDKISRNTSEGILKSEIRNPRNALFKLASKIINQLKKPDYSEYLELITFTNFGAAPNCEFFVLPSSVFNFLNKVLSHYGSSWHYFVRRYYLIKSVKWDYSQKMWVKETKTKREVFEESSYLNNKNIIYENLLAGKSITRQLVRIFRDHFNHDLESFPLEIAVHYAKEVLKMESKQLELIGKITDVVFQLGQQEDNLKKYLVMLESARKAYQFRATILKIIKANFKNGNQDPVLRLQEYVDYLFPDGQFWGEIRDLLLIHLYEKMHDAGVNSDIIPEEEIVEVESATVDGI